MTQLLSSIKHQATSIKHPASSIQHPVSSIQHPVSSIQHQASSIQHPASSIQHPASSNRYLRPSEVDLLMGNAEKTEKQLECKAKTKFKELVKLMVDAGREILQMELQEKRHLQGSIG